MLLTARIAKSNIGALIENPGIYPFMSGYEKLEVIE